MAFIPTTASLPRPSTAPSVTRVPPQANISRRAALLLPLFLIPAPALADHTYVAARRAYDRYHPRILAALETVRQIRESVLENDVGKAGGLINDKVFDVKARRAFSIYATSFSDNYLGERSRAMLKSVEAMYKELAFVAKGDDMGDHYGKAVDRLVEYYREARLPMVEIQGLEI